MNAAFGRHARRRTAPAAVLAAVFVLGLTACYPGGPESLGELNTVVTVKNPAGNHQGLRYYAMVDSVYEIASDNTSSEPLDRRYDATIIAEIQAQMAAAGFARVDTSAPRPSSRVRSSGSWRTSASSRTRTTAIPQAVLNRAGGINGALNKTASTNEAGIRGGIRQAFAQSPYIKAATSR